MGYGTKVDRAVGVMTRILHIRPARHDTVPDLRRHYLGLDPEVMFPAPNPIERLELRRTVLDRAMRASTITWKSGHEILCPTYRRRHEGPYRNNLTAWARWIRPGRHRRRECLVYVHGWLEPGSWAEETTLFRKWGRELPIDLVHVALPFHGPRKPRSALFSGEFFWTADLVRSMEGVRQAVCDVRTLVRWLRAEGYERVGVTGISLGGAICMVLACLPDPPDVAIPIISHLKLAEAVEEAPILWRMKHDLNRWGIDRTERKHLFDELGLAALTPRMPTENQLWIQAREDVYIDADLARLQWLEWGRPAILWIEGGHMTFPLEIDRITRRIRDFLEGRG